jgi:hypothetical protein
VIVIIGTPVLSPAEHNGGLAGTACLSALHAARAGARVELVGKVGEDAAGERLIIALSRNGIGHAAVLRDPAARTPVEERDADGEAVDASGEEIADVGPTQDRAGWPVLDAADVQLALRYLPDIRTILVAEPTTNAVLSVVADAARYFEATLIVVASSGVSGVSGAGVAGDGSVPGRASVAGDLVIESPANDPDGAFSAVLGEVVAAIDAGSGIDEALRRVEERLGVVRASP